MKNLIIMFVKEPTLGTVKTRLAEKTSEVFALDFYKKCVQDLLHTIGDFEFVLYSYPNVNFYEQNDVYKQDGTTLGDKMYNAFEEQFARGYDNIVLIGSDTPHLPKTYLTQSFEALQQFKTVIGPSEDGGYYLIGLQKEALNKKLFEDIPWSSPMVLDQTLRKLNKKELYLLEYLNDIDTLEDLKAFYFQYKNHESLQTVEFLKANGYG